MDSEAKVEIETTETVGEIGEGGDVELQVPDMPDLNMADILEEAALSTQGEEEGSFDAKAEKRKRLKAARVDRFNLEYVPDIQLPDDMLGEEEDAPEPETEPEPQPQRYVPEEPRDIYAEDELEAAQLLETASESTILSGASYDDNAVQRKSDFLRAFEIPSFSDISSEQSLTTSLFKESPSARESRLSRHSRHRSTKGSKILQRQSQGPGSKPAADDDDEGSSFEEESSSSLVIEIDSADLALDKFQAEKPAAVAIDTAAIEIFEFLDQEGDKSDQKRVSELARIKYRQELETIVGDFVDTLLTEIVTKWETELAGWQYKRRFDQEKLYADLQASVDSYMMESQKNTYLNAKLVEYNKRLKNSRSYEPLIPKIAKIERERYHRALYQLDHHKQRAAMAKKQNSYLVASVLMDFMHVENLTMDVDEHLENTIVQTFSQQSEGFKRYIDREVRRMQLTRYEISDVRLSLITRKHTLGVITEVSERQLSLPSSRFYQSSLLSENPYPGAHQRWHRDEWLHRCAEPGGISLQENRRWVDCDQIG